MSEMIYFDNAATSWPKPDVVFKSMQYFLEKIGGSPGRSGHRMSIAASRAIEEVRESIGKLFNFSNLSRIIFTKNITEAINTCLFGLLVPGDNVITTSIEHNSVMRPLRYLESRGLDLTILKCSYEGLLNVDEIQKNIKSNTKLIVLTHASNVIGTILPIKEVASLALKSNIPLLIDCAQTAGSLPIDINLDEYPNCIISFTGHKSLFGPTGTGGMCVGDAIDLDPLIYGGTGSKSDKDTQPFFLPDKFESGTINAVGLVGLKAGVDFIIENGVDEIRKHEEELLNFFINGVSEIKDIVIYGTMNPTKQAGLISFNIKKHSPSEIGFFLDHEYSIMCRIGLHCNPNAHKTIGTFPEGTIRFGFSYFNTITQVKKSIIALEKLCKEL